MNRTMVWFTLALSLAVLGSAAVADDWPMFRHDVQQSGCATEAVSPPLALKWAADLPGAVPTGGSGPGGVVVAQTSVYVGAAGPTLYALHSDTGAPLWTFSDGVHNLGTPTVSNDRVYVATGEYPGEGAVYVLDAASGSQLDRWPIGGLRGDPPMIANGLTYILYGTYRYGQPFGIQAREAETGDLVWDFVSGSGLNIPALSEDGSLLYTHGTDSTLHALNATTGAQVWSYHAGSAWNQMPPVVAGDVLYWATDAGLPFWKVHALDAFSGVKLWESPPVEGAINISHSAVVDNMLYIGALTALPSSSPRGRMYALDLSRRGEVAWIFPADSWLSAGATAPTVSDGVVYFLGSYCHIGEGGLYALDASTGNLLWQNPAGPGWAGPAVAEGTLFRLDDRMGRVYAYTPQHARPSGRIVFVSQRDGNEEIYTMEGDGANPVRLTNDLARETDPHWSPDGSKIAFYSDQGGTWNIWVMNADGTGRKQITFFGGPGQVFGLSWSPDGSRLVFEQASGLTDLDGSDLWVVDVDGSHLTQLTFTGDCETNPDWSPGGTRIAYSRFQMYNKNSADIWIINVDGSNAHAIHSDAGADWAPHWSPDGQLLVFAHDNYTICTMQPDGSNLVVLSAEGRNWDPSWSPDGRRIVFSGDRSGDEEIWTMGRDGSDPVNLTNSLGIDAWPDWGEVGPVGPVAVQIDIKPGSECNPVNPKSEGVIPVAVFSSDTFDATDIDPSTVQLAGAPIAVNPDGGEYMVHEEDVNADGLADLVAEFDADELVVEELQDGYAVLTGSTYAGLELEGRDNVTVVPHDLPNDHWALNHIAACINTGIVFGYPDDTYRPDTPVARDQMAVYVSRGLARGDANVPNFTGTPSFSDVPSGYWALKYIEYAVNKQIVTGYPDGSYQPTLALDRGQMAVFMARATADESQRPDLSGYTPPATPTFPDVPTGFWAWKFIEYIADPARAVTQGYPGGNYHPESVCTRDQMAVYVAKAFKLAI